MTPTTKQRAQLRAAQAPAAFAPLAIDLGLTPEQLPALVAMVERQQEQMRLRAMHGFNPRAELAEIKRAINRKGH